MADGDAAVDQPALEPSVLEEGGSAPASQGQSDIGAAAAADSFSYGAVTSSASRSPAAAAAALPDLTDRLRDAGIYGEYYAYKQKYLQWRKGGAQGASGELTSDSIARAQDQDAFEYWYPSPSIFKWRFTIAYWKGIFFLVGSLLFTFSSFLELWGGPGGYDMVARPNAIGAVFYTVGCYAGYLQLINLHADKEERAAYLLPDCSELLGHANVDSVVGTVAYFVGALIFQVGATASMTEDRTPKASLCLVDWPNTVGSMLFVIGAVCEHTHNQIHQAGGATWRDPVWWVAHLNLIGSVNFLLGSMPFLTFPSWGWSGSWTALNFGIGSSAFAVSSILMVVMWRANDFGLSLLKQLNLAMQAKGHIYVARSNGGQATSGEQERIGVRIHLPAGHGVSQEEVRRAHAEPKFSLRGTFFILIYCWFAFVAVMNCLCKQQWYVHSATKHLFRHAMDLAMQLFVLLLISLVLVIHSAVADVPDEQPFHCAMVTLRLVLLAGAAAQTIMFVAFFVNPHYDDPL